MAETNETSNCEMLHSLYDFKATYTKSLSFKTDEYFILNQTNMRHKNWWEVVNVNGETGFIPSNYVETINVKPTFYLEFLNKAINNFDKHGTTENDDNRANILCKLKEFRTNVECILQGGDGDKNCNDADRIVDETSQPLEETQSDISHVITSNSVYELVENVRINTQLSHEMSRVAVATVVQGLHELLPASVFPHLSTILTHVNSTLTVDDVQIDQTHDASRLKIILNELTSCKEDSQQRSWMLHEDEEIIKDYVLELISILSNADSSISQHVIMTDHYFYVTTLIQYYQMELRWSIRQLLLQTFGVLCSLDKTIVNIMLNSILPGELARDMMANPHNISKLNYSCILLTMIFSMGEPMPITHNDLIDREFLHFMFRNIEHPPDTDVDDQIPDLFLNCVISFNLQFDDLENPVLDALEEVSGAKIFTEKILLLLNREVDPVRIFGHTPAPPHSVIKLFLDLFNRKSTAEIFYTNDVRVLIDIIVRNISDLSSGDEKRHPYIELCRRVIRNTNFNEHRHRLDDMIKCFTRIFCEESELSKCDQKLVKEIYREFSDYFH